MEGFVDWKLAAEIAKRIGGSADPDLEEIDPTYAAGAANEGLDRVLTYTNLEPERPIPALELISRTQWIDSALSTLAEMAEPLESSALEGMQLPWLLGSAAQRGLGALAAAEAGLVSGYLSRKVLGQFDVALTERPRPARLLLIEPNVLTAAQELEVEIEPFVLWILIHEQTHTAQFTAVPWLREHLAGRLAELLRSSGAGVDPKAIAALAKRLLSGDPRESLRAAFRGELMRTLAAPEQRLLLDELQATMSVIEGYAEHVMDAAIAGEPTLEMMRERLDKRRSERGGLADAIAKLLGMGAKMRQYEIGKSFCDAVVAERGIESLNQVWSSPDSLPSLAQLDSPADWLSESAPAL